MKYESNATVVTFIFFTGLVAVISWYLTKMKILILTVGILGGRSLSGVVIAVHYYLLIFYRTVSRNEWKCFYGRVICNWL